MKRKAVFFDIDGTLANHNGPPHPADVEAIRRLRSNGHLAFVCTGRAPSDLYPAILDIGFDGVVCACGASIRLGDRVLWQQPLDNALLRDLLEAILSTKLQGVAEGEQSLYCLNYGPEHGWPLIRSADDFEGPFRGQTVYKFTLYKELPEAPVLKAMGSACDLIGNHSYCEVVPAGCSKASGIRRVLEATGIDRADSIAFGDGLNDVEMLQYAGVGVAMGNASDEIKRIADRVTLPYDQAGVAAALAELGL